MGNERDSELSREPGAAGTGDSPVCVAKLVRHLTGHLTVTPSVHDRQLLSNFLVRRPKNYLKIFYSDGFFKFLWIVD